MPDGVIVKEPEQATNFGGCWHSDTAYLETPPAAVSCARSIAQRTRSLIAEEVAPGPNVRSHEQIKQFVRDQAWGHHGSCSNRMGPPDEPMAVVDSAFRVYGAERLRVDPDGIRWRPYATAVPP